jgi:deazaflavin-dependent oxidoreductase (nitroreductase family)
MTEFRAPDVSCEPVHPDRPSGEDPSTPRHDERVHFNSKIIAEFRANNGKVGGPFEGADVLLLHHTGARSGTQRVSPLAFQRLGESFAVFASKAGAPENPAWYHNLLAHPDTIVEVGTDTVSVRARIAQPAERDVLWERQKQRSPGFAQYEAKAAPRKIPVVVLDPVK